MMMMLLLLLPLAVMLVLLLLFLWSGASCRIRISERRRAAEGGIHSEGATRRADARGVYRRRWCAAVAGSRTGVGEAARREVGASRASTAPTVADADAHLSTNTRTSDLAGRDARGARHPASESPEWEIICMNRAFFSASSPLLRFRRLPQFDNYAHYFIFPRPRRAGR